MVHYRKQLWGVFHYVVLSVLRDVTVGHIACGRLHVTENVFPDAMNVRLILSIKDVSFIPICCMP